MFITVEGGGGGVNNMLRNDRVHGNVCGLLTSLFSPVYKYMLFESVLYL